MKEFFKMFFASLFGVIIGSVVLFGLLIGIIISAASGVKSAKNDHAKTEPVLLIETNKTLHEQNGSNFLAAINGESAYNPGLYDAIRAIRAAKTDDKIKVILLKLEGNTNGWATTQQLREALVDFKQSHKKIFAFGETITQKDYYLASAADVLYLNPVGMMEMKGLASQSMFYKGTLDKLGVQPEIFYAGKFKSATEPFRAEKMSDANKLQISEVLHDIWAEFLKATAEKSKMDTAAIQQMVTTGAIQFPADAEKFRLIDGAKYWDELEAAIYAEIKEKPSKELKTVSLADYTQSVVNNDSKSGDKRIAILFAEGEIVDGTGKEDQIGSESFVSSIRELKKDSGIKAVVLRINSPGGSALASEVMLREIQLLQEKKPVIVSMGDLAASGGYYIASSADSIFAMPNTITGSIGVFSMMFNISGVLKDKLGVTFDEVKTNPYADFPTASRPLTEDEAARLQRSVDMIYGTFKNHVSKGRRISSEMVDSIAQGRVWTGTDAIGIGLVDGIGNLDRAIAAAAAKARISDYTISTYPEPADGLKSMMRKLTGNPMGAAAVQQAMQQELGADYQVYHQLQWLRSTRGKAQMAMPFQLNIQ